MKCCMGTVEFSEICYTKPGIYNYTVRELQPRNDGYQPQQGKPCAPRSTERGLRGIDPAWLNKCCSRFWTIDRRSFRVVVTITDVNGVLTADVEYPDGLPVFINSCCRCCKCC
jgi:hypothetical protein